MSTNPELLAIGLGDFPAPPSPDRGLGIWASPGASEVTLALLPASGRKTPAHAPAWYSPGFFSGDSEGPWFPALEIRQLPLNVFKSLLQERARCRPEWDWKDRSAARDGFIKSTREVLLQIQKGGLAKSVPIAFLEAPASQPSVPELAWMLLQALEFQDRAGGYLYGTWNAEGGILGVTPELLFERDGRMVRTMALAGTRALEKGREPETEAALLQDAKERHEHFVVIEGITQRLAGLGQFTVGETGVRHAGALAHLHTPIELELFAPETGTADWQSLVDRLHPTPALGAHPRREGEIWLAEQERVLPRSRFGAPFGVRLPEGEHCVVAIRNLEWSVSSGFCRVGAGAGVVRGSVPEREWSEIERKWGSVLRILGLEARP